MQEPQQPKYILKNSYQEKNADRNMQYHLKNLKQINNKLVVVQAYKKEDEQMDLVKQRIKLKSMNTKFVNSEIERERNYENQSLIDRMIKVNAEKQNNNFQTQSKISKNLSITQSQAILPQKSLISINQKQEEQRIQVENYRMVQRMNNLPPVINTSILEQDFGSHKQLVQISKRFHKLNPIKAPAKPKTRYTQITDVLNELSNNQFESSKSMLQFPLIDERINKNTILFVFCVQSLKVNNDYDLNNPKIPPKFCWELRHKGKSLCMTQPKPFLRVCEDMADSVIKKNSKSLVELVLWKIKNNDEQYIGQVEFRADDFDDGEIIQEFKSKMIMEKFIEKELFKKINNVQAFLGSVQIKLILYCNKNIPSNKFSKIPGSPRDDQTRKQFERIEESKLYEYDWRPTTDEERLILLIQEATERAVQIIAKRLSEDGGGTQEYLAKIDKLMQIEDFSGLDLREKKLKYIKHLKKQEMMVMKELLIQLEDNPQLTEHFKKIYHLKSKITKQAIDDACADKSFKVNQLLLQKQDDMGMSIMGLMLLDDDLYPTFLEAFAMIDMLKECDAVVDNFAKDIFRNLGLHLRKNRVLKAVGVFIESLENFPDMGKVIKSYVDKEENQGLSEGRQNNFLSNFDLDNYQHVLILGKVIKLCDKFLDSDNEWLDQMKSVYRAEKSKVYFKVPVLPKKGQLLQKKDLLCLQDGQDINIFHEAVRRKKWNLITKGYQNPTGSCMFFEKDCSQQNPFQNMISRSPFDVIATFFISLDDSISDQTISVTKAELESCISDSGKNIFHDAVSNKDLTQQQLLDLLKKLIMLLGEEKSNQLLKSAWCYGPQIIQGSKEFQRSKDILPLTLYLNVIEVKLRKNKKILKDMNIIIEIIKLLSISYDKKININEIIYQYCQLCSTEGMKCPKDLEQQIEIIYSQQAQILRSLCRFDDQVYDQLIVLFDWINWFAPSFCEPIFTPKSVGKVRFMTKNVHEFILLSLLRNGKYNQFLSVIETIKDEDGIAQVVLKNDENNVEKTVQIQIYHVLVCCLKEAIQLQDQSMKQNIVSKVQQKLRGMIQKNPSIQLMIYKGIGLNNSKSQDECLINQLYAMKQESLLQLKLLPSINSVEQEQLIKIINAQIQYNNSSFGETDLFKEMVSSVEDKQKLLSILSNNLQRKEKSKRLQDYLTIARQVVTILTPENFIGLGYCFLIDDQNLLKNQIKEYQLDKIFDVYASTKKKQIKPDVLKIIKYYVSINRADALFNHIDLINTIIAENIEQYSHIKARLINFTEAALYECLSINPQKGLYSGQNLAFYVSFIIKHKDIFPSSSIVRILQHFYKIKNFPGIHYFLMYMHLDGIKQQRYRSIISADKELYQYMMASCYRGTLNPIHWCITLTLKQFSSMFNDVKEFILQSEINMIVEILCREGSYEKLQLILSNIQDEKVLIKCINETIKSASDSFFSFNDKNYVPSNRLQNQQISAAKTKPVYYEKSKFNAISKWSSLNGVTQFIQSIYKQAKNLNNRLKNYVFYQGIIEKQMYKLEYGVQLRKSFLNQNLRSIFAADHQKELRDHIQVVNLLQNEFAQKTQILPNMNDSDRFEFVQSMCRRCWINGNPEKLQEWLLPYQPFNGFIVLQILYGAFEFFQISDEHRNKLKQQKLEQLMNQIVIFMKKYLNSKIFQGINNKLGNFCEIIAKLQRPFLVNREKTSSKDRFINQNALKFSTEIIFILEQNFTAQEMINLKSINDGQHLFNFLACLLVLSKNSEKRTITFLLKNLNRKTYYKSFSGSWDDISPTTRFEETNILLRLNNPASQEYLLSLAKQGVYVLLENNKLNSQSKILNLSQLIGKNDLFINGQCNSLEYMIAMGYDQFLIYYLTQNKPKGSLSSDEKARLILCALYGGNVNCIQIVFDDILGLKGNELKSTILNYQMMGALASHRNQNLLLWILRKKLKTIETFSLDEGLALMGIGQNNEQIENIKFLPLLIQVINMNMTQFYKEFFIDFLHKNLCKNSQSEYNKIILDVMLYKGSNNPQLRFNQISSSGKNISNSNKLVNAPDQQSDDDESLEDMNQLEYALAFQFYDVLQTMLTIDEGFKDDPRFNLQEHRKKLNENISGTACGYRYGLLGSSQIDSLLKQENYMQMNKIQALLRIYKLIKTQTNIGRLIRNLNEYERILMLSSYYRLLGDMDATYSSKSNKDPIPWFILDFLSGKYIDNIDTFDDLLKCYSKNKNDKSRQDDQLQLFFELHMYSIDKSLQYNVSIEKFVDKHQILKQNKFYTQIWKNKELQLALGLLLNENFSEGIKGRKELPVNNVQWMDFYMRFSKNTSTRNCPIFLEYVAMNDPDTIIKDDLNLFHDQRLLMIVLRSAAEKIQPEIIDQILEIVQKFSQTIENDNKDALIIRRNILNTLIVILMINPQRMVKSILKIITEISWMRDNVIQELQPLAQILTCACLSYGGDSLISYSNNLRCLMESMNSNITYLMMCEVRPSGDLGNNILDEKSFMDGVKAFIEYILKKNGYKTYLPPDTFSKIGSFSSKPIQVVQGDKFFKGLSFLKTIVDLGLNVEILSNALMNNEFQVEIQELEYRVEILSVEQAQKQNVKLLQQVQNTDSKFKFSFKLPIGIQKNETNVTQLTNLPNLIINQVQIDQAKSILSQFKQDKKQVKQ